MKNVLISLTVLGLVACSGGTTTTTTVSTPAAPIDCSKLDSNAADYPAACKAGPSTPPPAPTKCQYDPCEGDTQSPQ